jgi:hypothetical protein
MPIAENIGIFEIRFYDGTQMGDQWTEEMRSLPEFIEITLATMPPEKGDPLVETLTVTFPRLSRAAAAAAAPQGGTSQGSQQGSQGAGTGTTTDSSAGSATNSPTGSGGKQSGSGSGSPR